MSVTSPPLSSPQRKSSPRPPKVEASDVEVDADVTADDVADAEEAAEDSADELEAAQDAFDEA